MLHECVDKLALLTGQFAQLLPGQRRGRFPQSLAELKQRPDLVGTLADELIGQPCDKVRLRELMDLRGHILVASGLGLLLPNSPGGVNSSSGSP